MIKKLAGLLLAISTTASAQFVVNDDGVDYVFFNSSHGLSLPSTLKVGDRVYTDKLDLCINKDNKLVLKNREFDNFQESSSLFRITYIDDGSVSIESILEQDDFLLRGPTVQLLKQLNDEKDNLQCAWEYNTLKVESLFGYNSYTGLVQGVENNLGKLYGDSFQIGRVLAPVPAVLPNTAE
ncbi:hypothetical protein [Zooshikella harenae]|uniref:Uncharacterized protein n=1 Tax=Zooshikella harenae TaxID=2827238 RepID=A0ABS5ZI54_9GAMM|nr:hypothetical protein [Zooshikella harenae]MBU2713751.1 hypothetical protein [Zooshikella harenae]